jgi:hypothetical protein
MAVSNQLYLSLDEISVWDTEVKQVHPKRKNFKLDRINLIMKETFCSKA